MTNHIRLVLERRDWSFGSRVSIRTCPTLWSCQRQSIQDDVAPRLSHAAKST